MQVKKNKTEIKQKFVVNFRKWCTLVIQKLKSPSWKHCKIQCGVKEIIAWRLNGFAISFSDFNDFTVAFAIILALIVCCVSSLTSPRGASVRHTCTISFECRKTQGNSNSSQSELWHSVVFKIDTAELVCSARGIILIAAKQMAANVNVDFNYKVF